MLQRIFLCLSIFEPETFRKNMKKSKLIKFFKKFHKWLAVIIAFIAILFAASGIIMNHRSFFASIDVSRKLLPGNYSYQNWNLAAVRGSLQSGDANFIYGNSGIWKSTDDFTTFDDFNQGFPKGIDNRKIYSVAQFNGVLFAGTHMGLFKRPLTNGSWEKVKIPVPKERIADLTLKDNTLLILTRHYLLQSSDGNTFEKIQLPKPVDYKKQTGLFNTFWELHSGELFGLTGKLLVDLLGLVTILLSVTGLLHFFLPKWIKRKKKKEQQVGTMVTVKKKNLRWHNVAGYVFVLFLVINTFSGMHLRPPLLIAIANKQVGILPGTHLDSPNPWFDKLRKIHWDATNNRYIFSTSDGFYFAEETLTRHLIPAPVQPPVSVMGCNVLEPLGNNLLMVGSFSGMYLWNIQNGMVSDFFTGQPYRAPQGMTRPIGANTVAGFVQTNEKSWWFDYSRGAIEMNANPHKKTFTQMPEEIRLASPMSLWNVSLEIHTGRIFENIVGMFYILFVPIAGICILLVLVSGFFIWWLVYRRA
ncbi:PepSY-associated TM helix domain-containing protein [Prolixibacteraceae bacterium Z1-6]|uniref:PepSY-associated TM helix domain-containing protein n=1 Tax=Draconibacterium aestuarii TaxID=2998507 RepID=A0A9X3J6P1_9BACT|nr:PepSY-associated TM helix domain-containing protein [Prolixibacteraceae bacterium Z1-6]